MKATWDACGRPRRAWMRAAAGAVLLASLTARAGGWPEVALPPQAESYPVGDVLTVNGAPMRLRGFVAPQSPAQLASWFRSSIGLPLVQNSVGGKLVLGRADGEYYLTIMLEAAGGGSRGVLALSHQHGAYAQRQQAQAGRERLLARLPAGSHLVSQMHSRDGGRDAEYLMWSNGQGIHYNREHLVGMLRADGLLLERSGEQRSTLYFKGRSAQAVAVLQRNASGQTTIVLNTTTDRKPSE